MGIYGNEDWNKALESFVELPEMGYYDYDWDRFVSYYDPQGRVFYWISGSGCSCNDLFEDVSSLGDFNVGRKEELLRAAGEFSDSYNRDGFNQLREALDNIKS